MENDNARLTQRYRSLVLSHLYLLARDTNTPMRDLPRQTLARLGVSRRVDAASVTTFSVSVPEDLESGPVKSMMERFQREVDANRRLFSRSWTAEVKEVRLRPRKDAKRAEGAEDWDAEPLDEKALIRMASPP